MNTIIKNNIFRQLLLLYVLALLAFSVIRAFLYLRYLDHFSDLTPYETFASFMMGIRVDTIMTSTFFALFILLSLIITYATAHIRFRKIMQYAMFILLVFMLMASFGDTLYFEYVGRHMSTELMTGGGGDFFFLFDVIWKYIFLYIFLPFQLLILISLQ